LSWPVLEPQWNVGFLIKRPSPRREAWMMGDSSLVNFFNWQNFAKFQCEKYGFDIGLKMIFMEK